MAGKQHKIGEIKMKLTIFNNKEYIDGIREEAMNTAMLLQEEQPGVSKALLGVAKSLDMFLKAKDDEKQKSLIEQAEENHRWIEKKYGKQGN